MKPKKIFILLPDGIGLRNFAFTSFVEEGEKLGWEVFFWNQTPFDLTELGYKEIKLQGKSRAKTDLLKRAKINVELDSFEKRFEDPVYRTYKFPPANTGLKAKLKNAVVSRFTKIHRKKNGLQKLRKKLKASERKSSFYKCCKEILKKEQPDFIFCTNQRPAQAIAPLTAAQDLGISTGTFVFSWDNLPKATMVVEPDYYFVWSGHMKKELLKYYPFIISERIFVTGSPQFEPHFNPALKQSREVFFKEHGMDLHKDYICFSGDDKTTCPDDPQYLNELAEAVAELNKQGYTLGISFRRSPVDFTDRYDKVLEKHRTLIVSIAPKWKQLGAHWNAVLPTKEDLQIQVNTLFHSKAVVNLASSMVFDASVFNKPCLYLNYNVAHKTDATWTVKKVYNFVHFRSMPSKNVVIWLNSKEELAEKLKFALRGAPEQVKAAKNWFKKINLHPPKQASERIWKQLDKLI